MSKRKMPGQNRHRSEQAVGTPWPFIQAAERKLHVRSFCWDLAADAGNQKVSNHDRCTVQRRYFSVDDNALKQDWTKTGDDWEASGPAWNWLNPEFKDIRPWAEKCCEEAARGAYTAMLVPSSTGTNWWNDYVWGYAYVLALRSRIQFVGHDDAYPKDLALILYTPTAYNGMDTWDWLAELTPKEVEHVDDHR